MARRRENDAKSLGARLYALQAMREQRFGADMLVHHQKKGQTEDKIEEHQATATRDHQTTGPHQLTR
jgi:hypothetical protein